MDKDIVKNYTNFIIDKNVKSVKIISVVFFILLMNLVIILLNDIDNNLNCWNGVFFVLGNKYIYILFFIGTYLLLLNYFIIIDGNISKMIIIRLNAKKNWLACKLRIIVLTGLTYTVLFFSSLIFISIIILGYQKNWSTYTLNGFDIYTKFHISLTPFQSLGIYLIRCFLVLLVIGFLQVMLKTITKNHNEGLVNAIIFIYLLMNLVMNLHNIPLLRYISIVNSNINFYHEILQYLFSFLHLILVIYLEKYVSIYFAKGVEFI